MSDENVSENSQDAFEQLQILLDSIEQHPDEQVRNHVTALVYSVLNLHHTAFERLTEIISHRPDGGEILDELSRDELVKAVLMIHNLLPQSEESRLDMALLEAREKLKEYGADVELVDVVNGVAKLRLIGSAKTANVSTAILRGEIEQILHRAVPDLLDVNYEDTVVAARPARLVQIQPRNALSNGDAKMTKLPVIRLDQLRQDELRVIATGGIDLLLCNLAGTVYAFQNRCAIDGLSLEDGRLSDGVLICPRHECRYDIRHRGKSLSDPEMKLESLPVKVENEVVTVLFEHGALER